MKITLTESATPTVYRMEIEGIISQSFYITLVGKDLTDFHDILNCGTMGNLEHEFESDIVIPKIEP